MKLWRGKAARMWAKKILKKKLPPGPAAPRPLRLRRPPVLECRRGQPEVLLRRLLHALRILAAAFVQRLAAHLLGEPERLVARRVQAARRRVSVAEQLHDVLERHRHVAL